MTPERKKLMDRLRKLLALSNSSNQHEAELAMQRANELMEKYQIDKTDDALKEAQNEKVVMQYYTVDGLKMKYLWVTRLIWGCAKLYDSDVIDQNELHGVKVVLVGYPSDLEMVKTTFEHLYRSWHSFVNFDLRHAKSRSQEERGYLFTPRDTMKYKLGHGQGYAIALYFRCIELVKARKNNVKNSGDTGNALVVIKDVEVKNVMDVNSVTKKNNEQRGYNAGRSAGQRAGKSVALGGSVESGTVTGRITNRK